MATISETLLALNKVLQDYEVEVKKAGAKVTTLWVYTKERSEAREEIKTELKKSNIKADVEKFSESNFEGLKINESTSSYLKIIFKPKKGGGGSGAGAAVTKMAESAQAVYAAVAFGLGRHITHSDITPDNVERFKNKFDVDEKIDVILNQLPDDWIESSVLGANKLWDQFKGLKNGIVFHRGSKTVDHIENQFKRIKGIEGVRMDINKWSPADIYVTTPGYNSKCLEDERSIQGLNQCMNERINPSNPVMFGVSLKKMSRTASLNIINFDKKNSVEKEFDKFEMSPMSKDMYLHFTDGTKIQFRGFGGKSLSGWQGEVKGSKANQGKISLGPINLLLKLHDIDQIPTNIAADIKNATKKTKLLNDVVAELKKRSPNFDDAKFAQFQINSTKGGEFDSWLYSKAHGIKLIKTIEGISNAEKKKQVCEDFYLYANSKSKLSAPYWKLE